MLLEKNTVKKRQVNTPVETSISKIDLSIEILADPPTLDLNQVSKVNFSTQPAAVNTSWFIDNELVEISPNPILFFDTIEEHEIKEVAMNTENCVSSPSYSLSVHQDINVLERLEDHQIFYPNPSNGVINFRSYWTTYRELSYDSASNDIEIITWAYILNIEPQTQSTNFKILIK